MTSATWHSSGHGGAGKTTLAEALLAHAGVIGAPGSVTKGTSVCDFDPQEKDHQNSLYYRGGAASTAAPVT